MSQGKKHPYKEAKLVHGKRAYVEFYAFSEKSQKLERKRIFCPAKFKTVAMIERWANNVIPELNKGLEDGFHFKAQETPKTDVAKPKEVNIVDALIEALPIKKAELRNNSEDTYDTIFRKFNEYIKLKGLLDLKVNQFDESHILNYRTYLINEKGNVNRTANNNVISLGALFKICKTLKYIEKNPFEKFPALPETDTEIHEVFTLEHQIILENWLIANDPVLYLFTRFQYHAFIRPNEIRLLKAKNIDLKRRQILVISATAKNKKNGIVPMSKTLYQDYLSILASHRGPAQNSYVFGRLLHLFAEHPLSENYAYNRHCTALEACKLTGYDYTLYSWKHTGACRAVEAGVNVRKLQGLLRHSSLKETDRYLRSLGIALQNEELKESW
jgi:integrase